MLYGTYSAGILTDIKAFIHLSNFEIFFPNPTQSPEYGTVSMLIYGNKRETHISGGKENEKDKGDNG